MDIRLILVVALLLLSVVVDFTSKIMSIGADLVLVGLAMYFLYLVRKKPSEN